jgi:hypothetical protein
LGFAGDVAFGKLGITSLRGELTTYDAGWAWWRINKGEQMKLTQLLLLQ